MVLVVACGRSGYEPLEESSELDGPAGSDGGESTSGRGSGDPGSVSVVSPATFSSSDNSCANAASGPFAQVGAGAPARTYGLWYEAPFLIAATPGDSESGALSTYRLRDGELALVDQDLPGGFVEAIYYDGSVFFVGAPGRGLLVYAVDGAGELRLLAENTAELIEARQAWGDGEFVYVPAGASGLHAVRFDGTDIVQVGTPLASNGFSQGVTVHDDGEIYFSDGSALRILTFDGASFTERASLAIRTGRAWSALGVVFAANEGAVSALRRDGSEVQILGSFGTDGVSVRDVWSDGALVYLAASDDGVYAVSYTAATGELTERGRFPTPDGGQSLGLAGDSQVIFAGFDQAGLSVLRGFECTAP